MFQAASGTKAAILYLTMLIMKKAKNTQEN